MHPMTSSPSLGGAGGLEDSLLTLVARESFRKPMKSPETPGPAFIAQDSPVGVATSMTAPEPVSPLMALGLRGPGGSLLRQDQDPQSDHRLLERLMGLLGHQGLIGSPLHSVGVLGSQSMQQTPFSLGGSSGLALSAPMASTATYGPILGDAPV